ncbi:hypothetical protein BGZ98_001545 [Dissophora globulifera]|nr:hypothetical protein BGZ98_001545 [Dissophora globulifera]
MSGTSRYNGPGAAFRGQPRTPRSREDSYTSAANSNDGSTAYSGSDRQRPNVDRDRDRYDQSVAGGAPPKDLPDSRQHVSHQRQWSDTSSLQGGGYQSKNYPYNNSNSNSSPYMAPSMGGSPNSPLPIASPPSSSSSYYASPDQRGYAYPSQNAYSSQRQPSPSQNRGNGAAGGPGAPRVGTPNGYGQYDQSPIMSPTTPDSWRSSPGPRGYPPSTNQYIPSTQYQQPAQQRAYSTHSSVSNDDHGGRQDRPGNRSFDYDSDEYFNRQAGRQAPGYGGQTKDQGQGRFANDRGGRGLDYSTSNASNTSSAVAARRERNERNERNARNDRSERNERNQRQKPSQADEWLTSPTGTDQDTAILPWSDDEAIVTKAIRSPPTGYSGEKSLPAIPSRASIRSSVGSRKDPDMIKVEVGPATTIIPTNNEGSGVNFVKNITTPGSSPTITRFGSFKNSTLNSSNSNNAAQGPLGGSQSMTGAATSLRAAGFRDQKSRGQGDQQKPERQADKQPTADWGGRRISLDDILNSPSTVGQSGRQQAMNSWKESPPLRPRGDSSGKTDLKSKRRSSLPDKFVPDWNEQGQTWRSSIGQRRPSWMTATNGIAKDAAVAKDSGLSRKESQQNQPLQHKSKRASQDSDHTSDLSDRSRSWGAQLPLARNGSSDKTRGERDGEVKKQAASVPRRRDSYASTLSRSRSRSPDPYSRSRSRSPPYRTHSRSRSRSPPSRSGEVAGAARTKDAVGRDRDSSRFSWLSTDDANNRRGSWESLAQRADKGVSSNTRKDKDIQRRNDEKRYSSAEEDDFTDYDEMSLRKGGDAKGDRATPAADGKNSLPKQSSRNPPVDSDSDSVGSPPLKVQYARRPADGDDDESVTSSKHPASIISTFNLPPATSPTSPPVMPPLPTSYPLADGSKNKTNPRMPLPPPIPDSPPQSGQQNPSVMTSITTLSIEAPTSTLLSSRVSVASFKNVPGNSGNLAQLNVQDSESDFETDTESVNFKRDKIPLQPSYVSMGSTQTPSNPISVNTNQLSRNESTTSSVSVLSARSGRSFMSSTSVNSPTSLLPGSPPPQRAPPPIPGADAAVGAATVGSGLFATAKRSGSGGSGRGVRSGLNKQILPPAVPPPSGPAPVVSASKPSYGMIPPPIPSSFNMPSQPGSSGAEVAASVSTTGAAIQIQMLADEEQSKSQMGAITVESDERLLTRLNNRVAQLERELEFAQQDLETSQDETMDLQNKVQDLENELEELAQGSGGLSSKRGDGQGKDLIQAKEAWDQERSRLLQDLDRLREDHQNDLEDALSRERSRQEQETERLHLDHTAALEDKQARAVEDRTQALEDQKYRMETEHQQALDGLLGQIESLKATHDAKTQELQQEWEDRHDSLRVELTSTHQKELDSIQQRLQDMEQSLADISTERDQAINDLVHHKKETEQALDRLEVVLAEDKQAHSQLIKDLESKSKRLEDRIAELEMELQELTQDNVQIVEELQRREESWVQERALLRSGQDDEDGYATRLQEMHEQLVAVTESKRQADSQFQGIVKGLLREASSSKKAIEEHRAELEQERQSKEDAVQQLESIQRDMQSIQHEVESLQQEKARADDQWAAMEKSRKELETQLDHQKRNGNEAMLSIQNELENQLRQLEETLEFERSKGHDLEKAVESERSRALNLEEIVESERTKARDLDKALEFEHSKARDLEKALESEHSKTRDLEMALESEHAKGRDLEKALESEHSKGRDLEKALEQGQSKAKEGMQQEQFVWKTRLDQVEAALKTKEAQVRKLEQEADATIKIQTDLLQSMERDAANSQKKLEASHAAKMKEMGQAFEEEKRRLQQQIQQELLRQFEQDSAEKENQLQAQLDSIHKQELSMATQELATKHEQQLRALKQQHEAALVQSSQSAQILSKELEEQLEKLQQQAENERSEKEVAIKDRTFLERRMAGHDRRQKELDESLESLQQELDQSRAKFGQDLQEVERSKMSLERKLAMAKEDVEELNKIRDELEGDRDELRQTVQRLKQSKGGRTSSGDDSAAWEAERRRLKDQLRSLEDEVQIMLEKNMNLTIELSMKG